MRLKNGQIVLCLVLVMLVLVLLTLSAASVFLAVRAKNRLTNAGDAAALAVAKYQGELLNSIGNANLAHLKAALISDYKTCGQIVESQLRTCFLGPIEGINIGNQMAKNNGAIADGEMLETLRRHIIEVRRDYVNNPEIYPAPWEGAWEEYATALEVALGRGLIAGPDNINFLDAKGGHLLFQKLFYNAVDGGNWCWFHFNAQSALYNYQGYLRLHPLPAADEKTRLRKCVNSEVYSLGLKACVGSAIELLGKELICKLLSCDMEDLDEPGLLADAEQTWFFFDEEESISGWGEWTELIDDDLSSSYVGKVRDEFNVRGCAAVCRVAGTVPDLGFSGSSDGRIEWNAAAKPFGTVEIAAGKPAPVTAFKGFVVPAFSSVRLVSVESVGGMDLSTSDPDWALHTRWHVPAYLSKGTEGLESCPFCSILRKWDSESTRRIAQEWLRINSGSCRITSGYGQRGGAFPPH